ncbi:Tat pathway signal sequence [Actinomyces sp.]|uniref:Tat pathway signal sequence n=1 Tax=Actinomyces sp. TaxID=29317 RepID=UPI0026DA73F2|nr:Tat pathway signal sequence [Actinomyces sp.]MDO4899623.1 Tat pathway signal sequence [Actinomyces sp.]
MSRRRGLGLLVAGTAALTAAATVALRLQTGVRAAASPAVAGGGGRVLLDVAGPDGKLLDLQALVNRQVNGARADTRDDALLDSATLELIELAPLQTHTESTAALELPASGSVCLTLSWPTSHGYSAIFADLPGPGRHALAELAARSLHKAQVEIQTQLRSAAASDAANIDALRNRTAQALKHCEAAATPVERAARANSALEAATAAQLAQDEAAARLGPDDAMLGVTFTAVPQPGKAEQAVARLTAAGRQSLVRIVVGDTGDSEEMAGWRRCTAELHGAGAQIMVQVGDSQTLTDFDKHSWGRRIAGLIAAFPDADAWEIGNELAGEWTGPEAVERTLEAARALAAAPATASAPRVLTLYYQLGQGRAAESVMSWAATNLKGELDELTDIVGLSVYPQWHPLGAGARRVLRALERVAGDRPTALTELGYGAPDLDDGPWWFGSADDTGAGREAVARHLTAVALGQRRAWAAPLWWYYLQDEGLAASDSAAQTGGSGTVSQDLVAAARVDDA